MNVRIVEFARRAAANGNRRRRELWPLLRGLWIQRRYTAHYRRAARLYRRRCAGADESAFGRVYDVGVRVLTNDSSGLGVSLPDDFGERVQRVARAAGTALDRSSECDFFPPVSAGELGRLTADVAAVREGRVISIKLREPLGIDGVVALSEPLLDQLERRVYGCHLIVDRVYIYRSPVCCEDPKASWLWHFDNHPREMLKIMIYLTHVHAGAAPFEYLLDARTGTAQLGRPLVPLHGSSRIPHAYIDQQIARGWQRSQVTGPAGTAILFDDNVIHRGTLARTTHRDAIVFQVRPALTAGVRVDRRWTGSFEHRQFSPDPWTVVPEPRVEVAPA